MILAGIRRLLTRPEFKVERYLQAPSMGELSVAMLQQQADLFMMELGGEGESVLEGMRAICHLMGTWSLTRLIVCTALADARLLKQLKAMGVGGIYLKQDPLSALTLCIHEVMSDKKSYSPQIVALVEPDKLHPPLLTPREMDVLGCLFAGKSVTNTALTLHRDIRTISTHKRNAMTKLEFHNDCELYTWGAWLSRHGSLREDEKHRA